MSVTRIADGEGVGCYKRGDEPRGGRVPDPTTPGWRRFMRPRWIAAAVVVVILGLWIAPILASLADQIDFETLARPYLVIFSFVIFDAIIPIFPSESLLNTASTLAAQDGSPLVLWRIAIAGMFGAIVGDSLLYWLSRTVLRGFMEDRVEQAQENDNVRRALEVLHGRAPLLIVMGRFIPGMRFVTGATMGLARHPYPRFLLWDAIGASLWAWSTCIVAFFVGSVIDGKPVLSVLISAAVTTAMLALVYKPIRSSWEESATRSETPA